MVARIAPSPITTGVAVGDTLTHAPSAGVSGGGLAQHGSQTFADTAQVAQASVNPVPLPPSPPGEAFAAAVIAGQLPPVPMTEEQLRQRLGASWQPPASSLQLMDRTI